MSFFSVPLLCVGVWFTKDTIICVFTMLCCLQYKVCESRVLTMGSSNAACPGVDQLAETKRKGLTISGFSHTGERFIVFLLVCS